MHPWTVLADRAVFEELIAFCPDSCLRIIPWAERVDMILAEEVMVYSDGMTGSHFVVGGIDQIIVPLQVSSFIGAVVRLSTATFCILNTSICSWMSVPSTYKVWLRASWAWEQCMLVLFPHSFKIKSQASKLLLWQFPPVTTLRLVTSVQLSVM